MSEYLIRHGHAEIGRVHAERAREALVEYCNDPDNGATWLGGLTCDAGTCGRLGASVKVRDRNDHEIRIDADMVDPVTGDLVAQG